jgi:uncharacterized protein (TIGR03905 family)
MINLNCPSQTTRAVFLGDNMNHFSYKPSGVCSQKIDFDIDEENKLHNVVFTGGCNGNLKAIGRLVEGKDASEIATILKGNICGVRGTSCADQFSKAIESVM